MISRILKITAWSVIAVVGLLIIAFVILKVITDDQYKEWVVSAVESATGRDFSIEEFALDLGTSVAIEADGVRLANAPWSDHADMLSIRRIETEVNLFAVLKGIADINLASEDVSVLVESNLQGESNWDVNPSGQPANATDAQQQSGKSLPLRLLIREVRLADVAVRLINGASQTDRSAVIQHLRLETPQRDTTLSLSARVDDIPVNVTGNLSNLETVLTESGHPIRLDGQIGQNLFELTGVWGPIYPKANMHLALNVDVPSVSQLAAMAGLSMAELGQLKMETELSVVDSEFELKRMLTDLNGELADVSLTGSIKNIVEQHELNLSVSAKTKVLNQLLAQLELDVPPGLPSAVEVSAQLSGRLDDLTIKNLVAVIDDEDLEIRITGSVDNAQSFKGVNGEFELRSTSSTTLRRYVDIAVPDLGPVVVTGKVISDGDKVALRELDARAASPDTSLQITGDIAELSAVDGIDLIVDAQIRSLSKNNLAELEKLLAQLNIEFPISMLPQIASAKGSVSGNREKIAIRDIVAMASDDGVILNLSGSIDDIIRLEGVKAQAKLDAVSTAIFSRYAGRELPELGPLAASAKVESSGGALQLEAFEAEFGAGKIDAKLSATVDDLIAMDGVNATLDSSIGSLSVLSQLTGTSLPETGPVILHAELTHQPEVENSPEWILVKATSGDIEAKIEGSLADLRSTDDIQVLIAVTADSLASFSQYVNRKLPDLGPAKLVGNLTAKPGRYSLSDFQLEIDNQSVNGNVGIALAEKEGELSTLEGELVIPYLDLTPLIIPQTAEELVPESTVKETFTTDDEEYFDIDKVTLDRLFPTDPIPFEQLRLIDANFAITADRLKIGKSDMTDLIITLSLKDGLLTVGPINAVSGEGGVYGQITLDGRTNPADLDAQVVINEFPTPNLGGKLDLNLDLSGGGQSVAEIMGGINGQLRLVMRDGTIARSFVTDFGSSLFSFGDNNTSTRLECGILHMEIVDGIADFNNKLAAQMTRVSWRGSGKINFKTEKLAIGIRPSPRAGLGISAGSLASLVYIGGSLKEPAIRLNPSGIAMNYARYLAFLSTGGMSLAAESLFRRFRANTDICAVSLTGTEFEIDSKDLMQARQKRVQPQARWGDR